MAFKLCSPAELMQYIHTCSTGPVTLSDSKPPWFFLCAPDVMSRTRLPEQVPPLPFSPQTLIKRRFAP